MSKRMKRSLPYLQVMAICKPKLRKMLITHALSDVVMVKGVTPLTLHQKRVLSRYKTHLHALANKSVPKAKKKIP